MSLRSRLSKNPNQTQHSGNNPNANNKKQQKLSGTVLAMVFFCIMAISFMLYMVILYELNPDNEQDTADNNEVIVLGKSSDTLKKEEQNLQHTKDLQKISDFIASAKAEMYKNDSTCQWRTDTFLVGACFGLQHAPEIQSGLQCLSECCTRGTACKTWQYHIKKGCYLGDIVRFGMERAPTPNWCEPIKPQPWIGKRLKKRSIGQIEVIREEHPSASGIAPDSNSNNDMEITRQFVNALQCEWEGTEVDTQCFGLGPEIPGIDTIKDCAKYCCNDDGEQPGGNPEKACVLYQFRKDKGCFTGKSVNCDQDNLQYFGQRKMEAGK